jgi:deoxyribonuclease IV
MTEMLFGTVGSPISTPVKPGGSVGAISQIAALGLNAYELAWVQSVRISESTCEVIKNHAAANHVVLSVHAPYYINLNADDEEWPKSRKRLTDAAYFGYLAGATDIVFHPGSYFNRPPEEVLQKVIPRLEGVAEELIGKNVKVTLRPETMGKSATLGTLDDIYAMHQKIQNVLPAVDFAHLHARRGDGSLNTFDEWSIVLEKYLKVLGSGYASKFHIHLSGIEYTQKGEKNHLPISESDLNIKELFKALKKFHITGRIMCESPILEEDALLMKKIWQEMPD